MNNIGFRLKKLREAKNLNVKELAELINVPQSTYREWENGRAITGEPYEKLSKILNVSLSELLTGEKTQISTLLNEIDQIQQAVENLKKSIISTE